jgi:calcineurin-like phosphoesterase family protein
MECETVLNLQNIFRITHLSANRQQHETQQTPFAHFRLPRTAAKWVRLASIAASSLVLFACVQPNTNAGDNQQTPPPAKVATYYQWTQLNGRGQLSARVITSAEQCPKLRIDQQQLSMQARTSHAGRPPGFEAVMVCQATIPPGVAYASINGLQLPLPPNSQDSTQNIEPNDDHWRKIAVLGDTGCRVAGRNIQNCTGASGYGPAWNFAGVADAVERQQSDLIIHVGDYHYREHGKCDARCLQENVGYTWESWQVDFFEPAKSLLGQAPWVFIRGNHEDCHRSWKGWFYFFDEQDLPASPNWSDSACQNYTPIQIIPLGQRQLALLDSSSIPSVYDTPDPKQVAQFQRQFDQLFADSRGRPTWFIAHHPVWGVSSFNTNNPDISALEITLQQALKQSRYGHFPDHIEMLLAGHVHLFEALSFTDQRPTQFVFGGGGTKLSPSISQQLINEHPSVLTALNIQSDELSTFHQFDYGIIDIMPGEQLRVSVHSLDAESETPGPFIVRHKGALR